MEKKQSLIKQGFKRGFTLIELVFVTIIIAGLIYIVVNKVINNAKETKLTNIVNNDISQIVKAINKWKQNDAGSNGTFVGLTSDSICPYLPNTMYCDTTHNIIYSSGYHSSVAGGTSSTSRIYYKVLEDKISTNGDSFKIFANAVSLANAEHWDNRTKNKFEKIVTNAMKRNSIQPQNATVDLNAKDIGGKDAGFTDGGNSEDAMAGVRHLVQ